MDYFLKNAISASKLKSYLLGKRFGEMEREPTEAMTFGSAFHSLMVGEHESIAVFKDDVACRWVSRNPAVKTPRATNKYKEIKLGFENRNKSKYIVTDADYYHIISLRDMLYADPTISRIVNLPNAKGEQEFYFDDFEFFGEKIGKVKAKMDLVSPPDNAWVVDWKKTGVIPTPHKVKSHILYEYHYDIQAAWYKLIYEKHYGATPALLWIFIMDKPPYEYLMVDMSDFIQSGLEKIEKSIQNLKCGKTFRELYGDEFGICRLKKDIV